MRYLFFFLILLSTANCVDHDPGSNTCFSAKVIGKIRSAGGGIALSMHQETFGTHPWQGHENVVEALNIPHDLVPGSIIYFKARHATTEEKSFFVTADGNESAKPIIYVLEYSDTVCIDSD